jgi:regulator of sigma E protease
LTPLLDLLPTVTLSVLFFILAILILVTVHELGHYLVGRWRGIGADVFSVGFGPELCAFTDRRGTRWRLAALPLGGYVRFRGDASPASAPGGFGGEGSFEAASLRSRTLTVMAGPAANFLFAILIIAGSAIWTGIPTGEPRVGSVRPHPVESGLREGDLILSVAGAPVTDILGLVEMSAALPAGESLPWEVERDGERVLLAAPRPMSPLIEQVNPLSPAQRAGLLPGDVILELNGVPMSDFSQVREIILSSGGSGLELVVWRNGQTILIRTRAERSDQPLPEGGFESRYLLGVGAGLPFEPALSRPGPVEALQIGAERTWAVIHLSGSALANIVTGAISHCNIRGVVSMGEASGATASQGADSFILFMGLLSVVIGFMNLLPIPTLDGGHLALYAWEAVRGQAPSPRVTSALMQAGMLLLIAMMLLGLINDLTC